MSNFTRNLSYVLGTSAFLTAGTLNLSATSASAQLVAVGGPSVSANAHRGEGNRNTNLRRVDDRDNRR